MKKLQSLTQIALNHPITWVVIPAIYTIAFEVLKGDYSVFDNSIDVAYTVAKNWDWVRIWRES